MSAMSEGPLTPLPEELAALLATERERPGFSEVTTRRMLQRLEAELPIRPTPPRWPVGLGGFVAGLIVGGSLVGWLLGREPVRVVVMPAPVPTRVQTEVPLPTVSGQPQLPSVASVPTVPSVPAHRAVGRGERAHGPQRSESERDTALQRERALLETARTALARNQRDAITLLDRHAQQFPKGRLSEERESLAVQALVQAGRGEQARIRAAHFRKRWPTSFLAPVVDAALRSIP